MLVGDDIEGNEDDDGEENWGSVGEDVAEDVGDEEVGDVENSEEDGDEVRQTIDSIQQIWFHPSEPLKGNLKVKSDST